MVTSNSWRFSDSMCSITSASRFSRMAREAAAEPRAVEAPSSSVASRASLPGRDGRERVRLVHVELGSRDQPVDDLDRHRDLELGLVGAAPPADAGGDPQQDPAPSSRSSASAWRSSRNAQSRSRRSNHSRSPSRPTSGSWSLAEDLGSLGLLEQGAQAHVGRAEAARPPQGSGASPRRARAWLYWAFSPTELRNIPRWAGEASAQLEEQAEVERRRRVRERADRDHVDARRGDLGDVLQGHAA